MPALSLPAAPKIRSVNFRLQRITARNPTRNGFTQAVDLAEPLWTCEIETTPLSPAQAGQYRALAASLRGGARTLYLYDASWPRPLAYRDVADPAAPVYASSTTIYASSTAIFASASDRAWGAPVVYRYDRANSQIYCRGFRASAALSPGDYAAWDDGPARRLVTITEAATASSGGFATLSVEPAPPDNDDALPAALVLEKPAAEMMVLEEPTPVFSPFAWQATIKAIQVLRRF
jgi:hypothetical protein